MNEIELRAWHIEKKIMLAVESIDFYYKTINGYPWEPYSFSEVILMQSTPLIASNGIRIWDSDIVESSNDGKDGCDIWSGEFSRVFVTTERGIIFPEFAGNWEDEDSMYSLKYCKVVGNIYQNPELLRRINL